MSQGSTPLLTVRNLKKYFPLKRTSLRQKEKLYVRANDGISLDIMEGETFGLVGESGCGKSTFGRVLLQLYPQTEGETVYYGRRPEAFQPEYRRNVPSDEPGIDLTKLKPKEMRLLRRDLQLIFQDPYSSLNPRMTVGQIIGEGVLAHGMFKRRDPGFSDYIISIMEQCGLSPYMFHRYPHQFSGGQRQRIGIARSLAVKPRFVVCDEAVSALDVSIQSQILNLLMDLKQEEKLTYLFISHDLSVVKYISDRIGVMYLGNLVELAASKDLFQEPLHPYTEALLSAIPTTDPQTDRKVILLEGDIPSPVRPPSGCKFHTRCPYATDICKTDPPEFVEAKPGHYSACHHIDRVGEKSTRLSV